VFTAMGSIMGKLEEKFPGTLGKISLACYSIIGIIWFTAFIIGCIKLSDPSSSSSWRMWIETASALNFPTWVICPHRFGYNLGATTCYVMQYQNRSPVATVSGQSVKSPWGTQCLSFNYAGNLEMQNNYYLHCDATTTNGSDTSAPVKYYFVDQDGTNFTSCSSCLGSSDFFVLAPNHTAYLGLELTVYQDGNTVEPNAIITTPKATGGIPGSSYRVGGQSLYDNTLNGVSRTIMTWNTRNIMHWQRTNFYDFWQWIGYLGGAAFLFKLIHDFLIGVLGMTLFRGSSDSNASYAAIK